MTNMKVVVLFSCVLAALLMVLPAYGMIDNRNEEIIEPKNVFISLSESINVSEGVSTGTAVVIGPPPTPPVNWLEILRTVFTIAGEGTTVALGIAVSAKWIIWNKKHRKSTTPVVMKPVGHCP